MSRTSMTAVFGDIHLYMEKFTESKIYEIEIYETESTYAYASTHRETIF